MARSRLDADRLAAAYERDAPAARVLHPPHVRRAARRRSRRRDVRRAFELRRRFVGDPQDADALAAWVFGIARNVLNEALRRGAAERRALRRAGVQAPSLDGEELARIEELAALGELRAAVAGALAELADEQRDAVRLRVVEELDYAAVAGRLGISEQAARARVARAARARGPALRARACGGDAMSTPRDPDAILAELGVDLRGAWRRPPRRSRLAGWRRSMLVAVATLALVPTALATRDAVWAPAPAPPPDSARPPGAVEPRYAGDQVYVADGDLGGVAWRLSASSCDYAAVRAVGVFLSVPGGGGGARCDIATARDGAGA